jgi:hypothetical protein
MVNINAKTAIGFVMNRCRKKGGNIEFPFAGSTEVSVGLLAKLFRATEIHPCSGYGVRVYAVMVTEKFLQTLYEP